MCSVRISLVEPPSEKKTHLTINIHPEQCFFKYITKNISFYKTLERTEFKQLVSLRGSARLNELFPKNRVIIIFYYYNGKGKVILRCGNPGSNYLITLLGHYRQQRVMRQCHFKFCLRGACPPRASPGSCDWPAH